MRDKVKETREAMFEALYQKAATAGIASGQASTPTPMVVRLHSNMADDNSAVEKEWYVPDGRLRIRLGQRQAGN